MEVFKYFKLKRCERQEAEEPKSLLIWIKHGLSEFLGTMLLSFALAGLSIVVSHNGEKDIVAEAFLLHPILVGFYAGFIAVGLVLIIFLRWSCDLNPAVTITRWLKGTNTVTYSIFKITIQMVAGIVTGIIIYGLGQIHSGNSLSANHAISAINSSKKSLVVKDLGLYSPSISLGGVWIFFIELIMTGILLFPIFSKMISDKYRDFGIMFIISMSVWMGILGGSAAINPARGLAQQVPGLFFGAEVGGIKQDNGYEDIVSATLAMEAGTFLAPFFYVFMQGVLTEWVMPILPNIIEFRNFRKESMKSHLGPRKQSTKFSKKAEYHYNSKKEKQIKKDLKIEQKVEEIKKH